MFGRFLGAGAAATAVQYLVLVAGVELAGFDAVTASAVGFVCGAVLNYVLNHRYTYRSDVPHVRGATRFVLVVLVGLAGNVLLMALLAGWLGWNYLLSQLITTAVVMLWNFIAHSLWTFR